MEYQVTLMCATNEYKPVSAIVQWEQDTTADLSISPIGKDIRLAGIRKICFKRGWDGTDLKRYGYTKCKIRLYDKQKIAQENAERYEKIKKEKYASGEWKRPKGK